MKLTLIVPPIMIVALEYGADADAEIGDDYGDLEHGKWTHAAM